MFIQLFTLYILQQGIFGLHMGVRVPPVVHPSLTVHLYCQFQLGVKGLHSVKWYKDNQEFFKFMPDSSPQISVRPVEGVRVYEKESTMHKVLIRNVDAESRGTYKCEVTTKGPDEVSVSASGDMAVVVIPVQGPIIGVPRYEYYLGERIYANCTSRKTYPMTTLKWYFNDKEAKRSCINEEGNYTEGFLYWSFSRIRVRGAGKPGSITLTCLGSTGPYHSRATTVSIYLTEDTRLHKSRNSGSILSKVFIWFITISICTFT